MTPLASHAVLMTVVGVPLLIGALWLWLLSPSCPPDDGEEES